MVKMFECELHELHAFLWIECWYFRHKTFVFVPLMSQQRSAVSTHVARSYCQMWSTVDCLSSGDVITENTTVWTHIADINETIVTQTGRGKKVRRCLRPVQCSVQRDNNGRWDEPWRDPGTVDWLVRGDQRIISRKYPFFQKTNQLRIIWLWCWLYCLVYWFHFSAFASWSASSARRYARVSPVAGGTHKHGKAP